MAIHSPSVRTVQLVSHRTVCCTRVLFWQSSPRQQTGPTAWRNGLPVLKMLSQKSLFGSSEQLTSSLRQLGRRTTRRFSPSLSSSDMHSRQSSFVSSPPLNSSRSCSMCLASCFFLRASFSIIQLVNDSTIFTASFLYFRDAAAATRNRPQCIVSLGRPFRLLTLIVEKLTNLAMQGIVRYGERRLAPDVFFEATCHLLVMLIGEAKVVPKVFARPTSFLPITNASLPWQDKL